MSEIKPCPFCGGEAERLDIVDGENAGGSCMSCKRCFACGHVEFGRKENFVSRWNARPAEADLTASLNRASDACASVQRERDALREMLELLRDTLMVEVCNAGGWILEFDFGDDDPARDNMRRFSDDVRAFLSRYEGEVK